ncbi:MAG: HTH domain-containing protein [Candidatus Pacearchaeota archaeon]|nr:HTH domain-containing protein [Nanoarchaeota archaeon]MDZ4226771.1 HTH domain-containing protein [Candidatus Pacearchaeota archaeon]
MDKTSEEQIKEAFQKVRRDMDFMNSEFQSLKEELKATRNEMIKICEIIEKLSLDTEKNEPKDHKEPIPYPRTYPALRQINQAFPAHNPTHLALFSKGNQSFSTGNEGVPTDRQTNQQTDNTSQNPLKRPLLPLFLKKEPFKSPIEDAARILDSLDSLKKEIRLKFKQLTDQEILVFSTLYQLEEEQGQVDYKALAQKLNLTESSIRDYIGRLLKKGIPVEKNKINNKQIQLSISQSLKKVASLSTILQLRDI